MTLSGAVQIEMGALRELSIECWRLGRAAEAAPDTQNRAALLRAARRVSEVLASCGVEVVDLAGRTYDPGFVAEVIDVMEQPRLGEDEAVVGETVLPTLLFRGEIIERGQIIVHRAPQDPRKETVQ